MMEEQTQITHIKAKNGWFDIDIHEIFQYRDLIFLFVKRNYATRYKQTVLGPAWMILNPLITVLLYCLVFGNIAGFSTDGTPQFAFYLASNSIWTYFAYCLNTTSTTFSANSSIFGKVYFPRLTLPIATVITGILDLMIQVVMLIACSVYYMSQGKSISFTHIGLAIPIILQCAMLGLGCGIIVSSLTTKYRDLTIVVSFGVQLWMYISPVVYPVSQISYKLRQLYLFNPMAPIIEIWRYAFEGNGVIPYKAWGISWITTIFLLCIGVILFSHVEKTFMDTV